MRNDANANDAHREPDIIVFGREEPARSGEPDGLLRRLLRFAEPSLAVAGAGVMLLAGYALGGEGTPAARPAAPPSASPGASPRASTSRPWLIAPQAASAGETIAVLAHRNHRLCGATELRFDGAAVPQRPHGYAGPADSGREDLFVLMTVPRSATAGRHKLELYGPIQGGRGSICADVPEHQGRLATTTVVVRPSPR